MPEPIPSPLHFLHQQLGPLSSAEALQAYAAWWEADGRPISAAVDRAGTPWLKMFNERGERVDEILYPPDYWRMLKQGYQSGVIWRAWEAQSLVPVYQLGYLAAYYDPGVYCPYTVSLATALSLEKYGSAQLQAIYLAPLLRRDATVWQGATWMTEIKGGSDLGAAVETRATLTAEGWRLTGEKYFASNVGAELAVVAARPAGAPATIRGLALFLVPRYRADGRLNYHIRRLKDKIATRSVPTGEVELHDSEAHLVGQAEHGIYLLLEVLNISRVANSVASVALMHRALAEAEAYAQTRRAFGKPIGEHPLLARQFHERRAELRAALALAWEAVTLLDAVWRELPPYSERYQLFRLIAHLAKYWTAEQAVQTAKWGMEAHGGLGTLAEFGAERWLREAMILSIWEGTPHRQMLDGLEVMARKQAHRLLFEHVRPYTDDATRQALAAQIDAHLARSPHDQEAEAEGLFRELALFTSQALAAKYPG